MMQTTPSLRRRFAHAALALTASAMLAARAGAQLSVEWITQYGTNGDDFGRAITVSESGQIWVAGQIGTASPQTQADIFLSRLSPSGSVDFTGQRVSSGLQIGAGVAVVGSGTVFVGGYADQSVFDGSPGSFGGDGVVLRYDTNGTWQATNRIGSNTEDFVHSLAGNSSNLLVAGYTNGSFDGQTNNGFRDAFLSKRDSAGTAIWTRLVGTTGYEDAGGAAFDSAGNAYLAGVTQGSFPGFNNPSSSQNAFVARFDSAGNRTLLKQFVMSPGTGSHASDVGVDPSGNIYLAGSAYGSFGGQMNAGLWDAFLMKLDSAGNMLWARLLGTSGDDGAGTLDFDGMGHIWIAGNSTPAFGPNIRNSDGFVAEYDADGNLLGKVSIATSADESIGITIGPDGAAYATGYARLLDSFGDPIIGSSDVIVAKIVHVPEPGATLLTVGCGIGLLVGRRRRSWPAYVSYHRPRM